MILHLIIFSSMLSVMTGVGIFIYKKLVKNSESFENSIPVDEWCRIEELKRFKDHLKDRKIKRIINPESVRYN